MARGGAALVEEGRNGSREGGRSCHGSREGGRKSHSSREGGRTSHCSRGGGREAGLLRDCAAKPHATRGSFMDPSLHASGDSPCYGAPNVTIFSGTLIRASGKGTAGTETRLKLQFFHQIYGNVP